MTADSRQSQPQYSADRRWWWTGSSWVPAGPVATAPDHRATGGVPGWLAIPGLVLCVPVGLALTWLTRWPTSTKLIASGVAVLTWMSLFIAVAAAGVQTHPTGHPIAKASPSPVSVPTPTKSPTVTSSPSPATGQTGTGQTVAGKVTIVHPSQPLRLATSPGGEFSIAIPAGWVINPSQDGQSFTITPAGHSEPSIGIYAAISVSDLRATEVAASCAQSAVVDALSCSATELSDQLADSRRMWSAGDAFQALIQSLTQVANIQYGPPSLAQLSQTSATYEVMKQAGGSTLDDWGIIAMGYLNNPAFQVGTSPAYTSLAFVTGCEAAPDQISSMHSICKQALASFRPSQAWLESLGRRQMQRYQNEFAIIQQQLANERQFQQMISRFQSSMQQMQLQEFKAMQEVDARVGDGWHAALGGKVNMQAKNGDVYLLDSGYQSYCVTGNKDVVFESTGYLSPGQSSGGQSCDEVLGSRTS